MLFVDCREGLSGDMLLASMLALVLPARRRTLIDLLVKTAKGRELDMAIQEVREGGEHGLAISYAGKIPTNVEVSYDEAHSAIDQMAAELGLASDLPRKVLGCIFDAEAEAHGIPAREVHLHEIGRPQALLNMAGLGLVHSDLESAGAGEIFASTITTGKGIVVVSHGAVRVPAPAARILLRGLKHTAGDDPGERATPSGIAAIKEMISGQSDDFPVQYKLKGVGFGTKRFGGRLGRTTVLWV